ncbi:MAG: hypothetical protein SPF15_07030 [Candidatus Cryptobacteroides sp.]|uniref:hypothetical protein n=1 Tax=Candidatus Cryptobacteroides sp. TaxID=2952915 RepID=UPI002A83AED9|nr:hypothetical protein [Candidatus Cryptobacteroides sp.]MDY5043736.1 hypothetical protein [Candidatus Cryptobacteroides sp.]
MLRHAGMALEHLWGGSPCRRAGWMTVSPREDAPEAPAGKVAVPKDGTKSADGSRENEDICYFCRIIFKDEQKQQS